VAEQRNDIGGSHHAASVGDALGRLGTSAGGLTESAARERLQRVGRNELHASQARSAWTILLDQLRSVVVLLLVIAAAVAVASGDYLDGGAIGAVIVLNTLLGFFTEMRARQAMQALLRLETSHAVVVRSGVAREIDARELVPGDVIRLDAGRSVPADARVIGATELRTDEAALTGESAPVSKGIDVVEEDTPLPDRTSMLYLGTTVVAGTGQAVVVATGMATQVGHIGGLVGGIATQRAPVQRRLDALGVRLVWVAISAGVLVAGLGALQGLSFAELLQTGIALAVAAVPEGLPAVATIALAAGVRRMARRRALVRRLPAVETLGSVTVICTDKTGTLTAGEMTVTALSVAGRDIQVTGAGYAPVGELLEGERRISAATDPPIALVLRIAALANRAEIHERDGRWHVRGDPTEGALIALARKAGVERDVLLREEAEVGEVPFSSERMLMATLHQGRDEQLVAYVKGGPSRVLERCTRMLAPDGERPLDEAGRAVLLQQNERMAARGLRVLALASGVVAEPSADGLRELTFVGYAGMIDPPAPGVRETIARFRAAGVRTVMLTGDQKLTAETIARELGILDAGDQVIEGRVLARMTEAQLAADVTRVAAFSRASPEDKMKIIAAYQSRGAIVAMFGDGVNDAAALKQADVGVAMGGRGTDVAKEAADVVLQDDSFRTIGAAVEQGRVIFDNIRKFVFYLFSCNLAEILLLVGTGIAGFPMPLLPIQLLWLNLVTDTFPALALAVEPAEDDVMRRPPRDPAQAILSGEFLRRVLFYAVLIAAPTFVAFWWGLRQSGPGTAHAATLAFLTISLAQVFHLGNARQRRPVLERSRMAANPLALWAVVLVLTLQLIAVYMPVVSRVLHTQAPAVEDWAVVLPLSLVPAITGQILKYVHARRNP
jgi:Ca2+-transporting ATPase